MTGGETSGNDRLVIGAVAGVFIGLGLLLAGTGCRLSIADVDVFQGVDQDVDTGGASDAPDPFAIVFVVREAEQMRAFLDGGEPPFGCLFTDAAAGTTSSGSSAERVVTLPVPAAATGELVCSDADGATARQSFVAAALTVTTAAGDSELPPDTPNK